MYAVNFLHHENPKTWDGVEPANLEVQGQCLTYAIHVIGAIILHGKASDKDIFMMNIPIIPLDVTFLFKMLQFMTCLNFTLSIFINTLQTIRLHL
ncbi:hypothetical protein TNCV_4975461 [Trichonephila clavipes]|uniref:Uncharacterized protein n=1 Tax=Trichonephila clavipes TaxID=2585209 RepID=A0A8X6SH19_TRICX|nr:hypothetical protein TNCV_4975461 [Trichonephila clavipes]